MEPEVSERLDLLQSQLFAQERRVLQVLINFISLWFANHYSHACRRAIISAFVWTALGFVLPSSRGSTPISFAIVTIVLAVWANLLMWRQNVIMNDQTKIMEQQAGLAEATAFISRVDELQKDLSSAPKGLPLSESLHIEVVNWSQLLVPYKSNDASGRALSRERGRLLRSLVNSPADTRKVIADADFTSANLREVRFQPERPSLVEAHLEGAVLDGAVLTNADLRLAFLRDCALRRAFLDKSNLKDADLSNADLAEADLRNADLRYAKFTGADLTNANLEGAIVEKVDWIETITKLSPPVKFDRGRWRVVESRSDKKFHLQPIARK